MERRPVPNLHLKRDALGAVTLVERAGERRVRRDVACAWALVRPIARLLLRREARALEALAGLDGVPRLCWLDPDGAALERSFVEGAPLQEVRPRDPAWFAAARRLVLRMHRRGVVHNDLAKEPNWLVTTNGAPAIVDFQLARVVPGRARLARAMMREDLRHLLKHKRTYCPDALTPVEKRLLRTKTWLARAWRQTGKRAYNLVTRRLLRWRDAEGRGATERARRERRE